MSNFKSQPVSNPPENPGEIVLSLKTVHKMLALVKRIIRDHLAQQNAHARLLPEEAKLDRDRRNLDWPGRQRRYQIKEEIASAERSLEDTHQELRELGLVLLDADDGRVGFPTLVNNRRAYFSWQPGDEEPLGFWQFADEDARRPIPASWLKELTAANG